MPKPVTKELLETQVTPDPALEKRGRRNFASEYKLRIVAEADACRHGELSQLLRREKLYSSQVIQWRKELENGGTSILGKSAPGPKAKLSPEQKEISKLEKRIKHLERELDISNSCIELQKKSFEFSIYRAARTSNEYTHGGVQYPRSASDTRLRCIRREPQHGLCPPGITAKRRATGREPITQELVTTQSVK